MSNKIARALKDKKVVITGGTGSFGGAALSRFLEYDFSEIRIFSRDEKKQEDMRSQLDDGRVKFYIGDVRNFNSVKDAIIGADYVFHAAALKQVPSCEFYPMEAVQTNILGAENVMRAAVECGVNKCVVLSTDKAVYPINAMGLSKALMEKLMVAKARLPSASATVLCATRYGNVMASRGSVIPLFMKQIKAGVPLTITDPNMTRFLMSLEDSVDLVLHAFHNARPGDIFVQKSPASTILDLANAIRELLESSTEIKIIGTRHGEKLFETLVSREEKLRAEIMGNYYRISADVRDLNYGKNFNEGDKKLATTDDNTSHNTNRLSVEEIKLLLLKVGVLSGKLNNA
jgi:UDP-glucose 4-epimerase